MKTKASKHTFILILLCALLPPSAGAEKEPVDFDDIMAMKTVGAPMVSPDGEWVLFTVGQWETSPARREGEPERKDSRTHIWRVSARGEGSARQLTFGEGESAPAWSPDGKWISFLAARDRRPQGPEGPEGPEGNEERRRRQVWVMSASGGEAWKLTDAREGLTDYAWSPDAQQIAYTAREPLSKEAEEKEKRRDDPRVFEGDFRPTHVWTVELATKKMLPTTRGAEFTVRGRPQWSPDGETIAFTAAPTPMIRDDREDVYLLSLASGATQKITDNPGPDHSPAWSPDGTRVAYLSEPNTGKPNGDGIALQSVGNTHLVLYDVAGKRARDVASPRFDLSPGEPTWTPDGKRILFGAGSRAYREMFAYEPAVGRYVQLTSGRNVSFGSLSKDGARAAFTMDSADLPSDVYVADAAFGSPQKLTHVNPQVGDLALGDTEVVTWNSDGFEIEGVLLKPVGFAAGKRYPLLVVVHGGPTGAHHNNFRVSYGDGGQNWAGHGWAVLYPNPRGSTNYGEKFMRANIPDWGGGDYRDIMAGVDALIARGLADPDRLALMGWSYGGYLTCWTVSQTTRFKAAMMGAGLSNLFSMYGTNDIPNYLATFFGGIPADRTLPLYLERSGLTHVDRVTTPLLILHGGNDERVPIGQPMEFYRALKDRGKTVELVFYPREGHGLGEYYHRLDRLKRQYEWITRYTLGVGGRPPTSQ